MNKKAVILGIDALEYDLVEKYDSQILKQVEYGKVNVPILTGDEDPKTPTVWASFITGASPEVHGVTKFKTWNNPVLRNLEVLSRRLGIHYTTRKKIGFVLQKFGMKKKGFSQEHYKGIGTIFDDIKNSKAISIPSYNEDPANFELRKEMVYAIGNKSKINKVIEKCLELDKKRMEDTINAIGKYDLIFVHIFILDPVQHLLFKNFEKIRYYYRIVENFVEDVKNKIDDQTLLLIVSDHGQKKGIHTPYGFYSSNVRLGLNNPSITDFREIIKNYVS